MRSKGLPALQIFLTDVVLGIMHEYATTGNLHDMLKSQGPFQESLARFFFQQLMCGIRYLHERGVTHGDIRLRNLLVKPFNFTFSKAPVLKISHFGCAKEDNSAVGMVPPHKIPPRPPSQGSSRAQAVSLRSGLRSVWPNPCMPLPPFLKPTGDQRPLLMCGSVIPAHSWTCAAS